MKKNNKSKLSIIFSMFSLMMVLGIVTTSCRDEKRPEQEQPTKTPDIIHGTETGSYPVNEDSPMSMSFSYANSIANRVQGFYTGDARSLYAFQNTNMSLVHRLDGYGSMNVTSISNSKGVPYANDTLDTYIKLKDGTVFYSGNSQRTARMNTVRLGYYYYETHIRELDFAEKKEAITYEKETDINIGGKWTAHEMTQPEYKNGEVQTSALETRDPYIFTTGFSVPASDYNAVLVEMKASGMTKNAALYFFTSKTNGFNAGQLASFRINSDNKYHTYLIDLSAAGYDGGALQGVRFDMGENVGDLFTIRSVKAVKTKTAAVPYRLDKTFHVYSDKLHQEYRLVKTDTDDKASYEFAEFGVEIKIPADKISDSKIEYASDGTTPMYAAMSVKDVGVIGFIMPADDIDYNVTLTDENGYKVLRQSCGNKNFGSRIYTDETQSFDGITEAAYEERNPLTKISVSSGKKEHTEYLEYDPLRGAYHFKLGGSEFNQAYYKEPDYYFTSEVSIENDTAKDRKLYIWMNSTTGALESAAAVDSSGNLMPIPMEVCKNFRGEMEEPFYEPDDTAYGDSFMPLHIAAGQKLDYTHLHLYQNWGRFPLKQISSIQFHISYYHLSTGVTESNCIAPYFVYGKDLWTLPDFRGCSGNMWATQPQFNAVGRLRFVSYMNEGHQYASEYTGSNIRSSGNVYADMDYNYVSDCGSYKYTLRHAEFPQNDENRTYYTLSLEFLKDITIKDVKNNFTLFSMDGRAESFSNVGFTDENGKCAYKTVNKTNGFSEIINIGSDAPYFTFYGLEENSSIMNFAYIIKDYDIKIGGSTWNGSFAFRNMFKGGLNYGEISLMEDDVTFKKGDHIIINFILLPWGSGLETTDENVQYVRQDTVFNPIKMTAITGTVIEDKYLPIIKANENTAEFILSGGRNRFAVKVDGMTSLNGIAIQENIDGQWKDYEFQRKAYDGYQIFFNEDGTYSYVFIIEMDENGAARTFKVTAK